MLSSRCRRTARRGAARSSPPDDRCRATERAPRHFGHRRVVRIRLPHRMGFARVHGHHRHSTVRVSGPPHRRLRERPAQCDGHSKCTVSHGLEPRQGEPPCQEQSQPSSSPVRRYSRSRHTRQRRALHPRRHHRVHRPRSASRPVSQSRRRRPLTRPGERRKPGHPRRRSRPRQRPRRLHQSLRHHRCRRHRQDNRLLCRDKRIRPSLDRQPPDRLEVHSLERRSLALRPEVSLAVRQEAPSAAQSRILEHRQPRRLQSRNRRHPLPPARRRVPVAPPPLRLPVV
jgi:hypothetical protein